ncbi:MAG TPA: Bcr/CflA family efflux MFS transporter, partial [Usitatibacter sp.]|nr:Bcr/CflA family efflux MFS transporter [Usitatibacter sp.]
MAFPQDPPTPQPAPHRHASRSFRWAFAAMLAALATLGPFSIDAYLPAFSGIQDSLAASPLEIQQTLSAYLFAFGLMFLFHGALSDSFGRRPVILVSLAVYTIASMGGALASDVQMLIFWRVVQGLSVGAGMVVGRAMIRDLYNTEDAQRLMSMVTLFFGLAPAVAPVIGGWLFAELGWRSVFWFLTLVGALLVGFGWWRLPETLPETHRQPFHPVALIKGYEEVGIHARFLLLSLVVGFNFNAFFLYIVSAPVFLGEHL